MEHLEIQTDQDEHLIKIIVDGKLCWQGNIWEANYKNILESLPWNKIEWKDIANEHTR